MQPKISQNYVKVHSKCGQNAVKIQSKFSQNSVKIQSKCSRISVKMQSKCSQNSVKVQPKFSQITAKIQSKCSRNAAKIQSKFSLVTTSSVLLYCNHLWCVQRVFWSENDISIMKNKAEAFTFAELPLLEKSQRRIDTNEIYIFQEKKWMTILIFHSSSNSV